MEPGSRTLAATDCESLHKRVAETGGGRPALVAVAVAACTALACGDGGTVPVDPLRPVDISLTPDSVTMRAAGDTARFVAEVRDQNGAVLTGDWVAWSSSDTSVATVDATGLARAAGDGLATILATAGTATDRAVVLVITPRGALADFYEATAGAQWLNNAGWLTDEPLASWYGVTPHASLGSLYLRGGS